MDWLGRVVSYNFFIVLFDAKAVQFLQLARAHFKFNFINFVVENAGSFDIRHVVKLAGRILIDIVGGDVLSCKNLWPFRIDQAINFIRGALL